MLSGHTVVHPRQPDITVDVRGEVPAKPIPLPVNSSGIPDALKFMATWVCWRYLWNGRKWTKPPYQAVNPQRNASTTASTTWATFEVAHAAYQDPRNQFDGIGLVLQGELSGIDLDHVARGDDVEPWAAKIVEQFNGTYIEHSPGGDGIRIFCTGKPLRCGKGGPDNHLEVYSKASSRYLTVTGHRLSRVSDIVDMQDVLVWLHNTHMDKPKASRAANGTANSIGDEQIITKAREAANGSKFLRLWSGDAGDDHSSSDLALCSILAFWTQDHAQIDRLFRRSGLMRDKWDSRRDDSTYGAQTIVKALHGVSDTYSGPRGATQSADRSNDALARDNGKDHDLAEIPLPTLSNGKPKMERTERESVANKLIDIGSECELFHDDRRDGYAVVLNNGVRMTWRIRGREFKRWLAGQYWQRHNGAPNGEAIQSALNVLESKATFDGRELTLSNRFAHRDNAIFIDLCDSQWRAVKITANGWEVLDKPPVVFRRYQHQRALPVPTPGGRLDDLDDFLNVASADDRVLLHAALVTTPLENVPRPIVTFHGPQGSGKSSASNLLRKMLDPSAVDNLAFPKKHDELAQILDHHAMPCFDNLKTVDSASADMLCRAVTGGGFSKRELFSDSEDIIFSFKRPMILNGINIPTHAPDLLDRMMLIELERIPESRRRTETEMWQAFNDAHPRLFGALLDNIAVMLATPIQAQKDLPRLADFAQFASSWSRGVHGDGQRFVAIYARNISRQTDEAVESDDVAVAIRGFVTQVRTWEGTPTDLLKALNERRGPMPAPEGWPRKPNSLSRRLRVLQATLAQVGIFVTMEHSTARTIRLAVHPKTSSEPPESSERSSGAGSKPDDTSSDPDDIGRVSSDRISSIGAASVDIDDSDGMPGVSDTELVDF